MMKFIKSALKILLLVCFSVCAMSLALACDPSSESTGELQSGSESSTPKTYTVTFDADGGSTVTGATVNEGDKVEKPADPTKEYYDFVGWYNDETAWDFENDVVSIDLTLKAKWTAKTYSVVFIDFDGEETTLTYTVESVSDFELPLVSNAPEGYENARWNKELADCIVYSETPIRVEAEADVIVLNVALVQADATAIDSVEVNYGDTLNASEIQPTLDGYMFKSWLLNGEEFDLATSIKTKLELVATWFKVIDDGEKQTLSASWVAENSVCETGYVSSGTVMNNEEKDWNFDSDYSGSTGSGNSEENKFAQLAQFGVTADGGDGNVPEGRETYIILPAINYNLYSKVDFAYKRNGNITKVVIEGTDIVETNTDTTIQISIVTDAGGTYLLFRSINSVDLSDPVRVELSAKVINGEEGLKLAITTTTWVGFKITEFHVTERVLDYQAKLASAIQRLEVDNTDADALADYISAETCLNEYERNVFVAPDYITEAIDNYLADAVVNAEAGSKAQLTAIEEYRAFHNELTDAEKETEVHKTNVARVNAVILTTQTSSVDSIKSISGGVGTAQNEALNSNSKFNDTTKYPYTTFSYSNGTTTSATFTLNAFNYSAYDEVYFGIAHAMTYNNGGSITIAGQTFEITKLGGYCYRMKATIKNGVLTLTDDGSQSEDMAVEPYYFQVSLSESVLNGTEGLAIEFTTGDSYSWLEVTNMIVSKSVTMSSITMYDNQIALSIEGSTASLNQYHPVSHWESGAHTAFMTASNEMHNVIQINAQDSVYTATVSLPGFNFDSCDEAYFAFTAATAAGDATVTINGESYTYDLNDGYVYVKMIVKDGVLTVVGDGANNLGQVYLTVELSEAVLNGTDSLVITWQTAGWSCVEVCEVYAINYVEVIA